MTQNNPDHEPRSTQSEITNFSVESQTNPPQTSQSSSSLDTQARSESDRVADGFWRGVGFCVSVIVLSATLIPFSMLPSISGNQLVHQAYL